MRIVYRAGLLTLNKVSDAIAMELISVTHNKVNSQTDSIAPRSRVSASDDDDVICDLRRRFNKWRDHLMES